ncbi:MAG: DUF7305 domain-containing protein [Planctomycetota bacterium]|jgi:hypothetical protein
MTRKIFAKFKKRGSVLAMVLFAIVLLLLSGMGVLTIGQTSRIFAIRTAADVGARAAADTGITKAIWAMNTRLMDGTWNPNKNYLWEFQRTLPNSDATYSYFVARANWYYDEVMPTGDDTLIDFFKSAAASDGDYIIASLGRYNAARRRIYATVRIQGRGDTCVIVRDQLTLKANTLVAGADSRNGSEIDPTVFTEIGTTSIETDDVVLNNGVTVMGNIVVGVNGDVDTVVKDLGATTGLMYPMPEEVDFPYVYPPEISDTFPAWDIPIRIDRKNPPSPDPNVLYITETLAAGGDFASGRYTCIDLESNNKTEKIIIPSGNDVQLHLTNTGNGTNQASIMLGVGCEIIIEKGATLNLWVDGNIRMGTDSGFNNLGTPPQLKIWGNWREPLMGQSWTLNAKSEYFGQIYAPNADVVVNAKGDLYGAFTAYTFDMRNGGNLIYDGALRDVNPTDPGVIFALKRWYEL